MIAYRRILGSLAAAVLFASTALATGAISVSAALVSDNYDYKTATCRVGTDANGCTDPQTGEKTYDWGYRQADGSWRGLSQRLYGFRNCTDWASFHLQDFYGVPDSVITGLGNGGWWSGLSTIADAVNWRNTNTSAQSRGLVVDHTPAVGAAVVTRSTATDYFGHVAVIDAVDASGTATISQYNANIVGTYTTATLTTAQLQSRDVVHFEKFATKNVSTGRAFASGSLARNGGFESGGAPWAVWPGTNTNFVIYSGPARNGQKYGATNTTVAGGGIFQDVAVAAVPGDLFCASAWVRTEGNVAGASGRFVVWLVGGAYNESGTAQFTGLSTGSNWRQVETCVAASTNQTTMRVQLYPDPGSKTINIDDVDVH